MNRTSKIVVAGVLSVVGVVLAFVLDEIFIGSRPVFTQSNYKGTALFLTSLGVFFLVAQYLLSRGGQAPIRKHWPIFVALNWAPLLLGVISTLVEPWQGSPEGLYVPLILMACSCFGWALAARF